MFWGKNLKSGETYSLDSEKRYIEKILNITNISLSEALDNTKYHIKIIEKNNSFQLCTLDKSKDSISTSLSFFIKPGMKLSVKGGKTGVISFVGFIENFDDEKDQIMEEINTDKIAKKRKKGKKGKKRSRA